jgi:hypothetical protein
VHPDGGRGGACSSEVRARSGLNAAGEASVGAHGHVGVLRQWRPRAEMEFDGGGVNSVAGTGMASADGSALRGGGGLRVEGGAMASF